MSYKLYTDKINKFQCTIQVDGTSLANSKVRLVIESDGINYMFDGRIADNGNCEVIVPKTKNFLSEDSRGMVKLEVIADDVFFEPWSSEYLVETNKKVNVIVQEQIEEKPKMKVAVMEQEVTPKQTIKPTIIAKQNKIVETKVEKKPNTELTKKDIINLLKSK